MKIIQGKYKGIVLKGFDIDGTRPTMDRVKESLFAMIQNNIKDKNALDLFAGSGNLGIEALSMGAKSVYFVDKNPIAIKTIKENLNKIKIESQVLKNDYKDALKAFENKTKFDLIFLDPPYKTNYIEESLKLIERYDLLNKDGLVVCESDDVNKIKYSNYYQEYKNRKYSEKIVVILKR